jgi:hypothetical protein
MYCMFCCRLLGKSIPKCYGNPGGLQLLMLLRNQNVLFVLACIYLVLARKLYLLKISVYPDPKGSADFQQLTPFRDGVNKLLKIFHEGFLAITIYRSDIYNYKLLFPD